MCVSSCGASLVDKVPKKNYGFGENTPFKVELSLQEGDQTGRAQTDRQLGRKTHSEQS